MRRKTIVYCICSYLSDDCPSVRNLLPLIKDMEIWANAHHADFKLITKIPDVIEDMFSSITTIYKQRRDNELQIVEKKNKLNEIGLNILKHADNTAKGKNNKAPLIHRYKSWVTKFEIIQDFYKSDYERMMYLDCDLFPCIEKREEQLYWRNFNFNQYDNMWYMKKKYRPTDCYYPVILVPEKYLKKHINHRYLAGTIILTKNYKHNVAELFSYNNIYDMWLLDSSFIREETVINFIVHKNDICEDIMPDKGPVNDRTIICPACHRTDTRAHHFPLVHIGGKKSKASFTYEKQWLIKT